MPCYDPIKSVEYIDRRVNGLTAKQLDAILCGVLDVDRAKVARLKPGQLIWDLVDWVEVGLPRSLAERWRQDHRERRWRETAEKRQQLNRRAGLAKLTDAEKKALGLKGD